MDKRGTISYAVTIFFAISVTFCEASKEAADSVQNDAILTHKSLDRREILEIRKELVALRNELTTQKSQSLELKATVDKQNKRLQTLERSPLILQKDTPSLYQTVATGCAGDVISLTCYGGRVISIDDAVYGEYDVTCDDDCCSPLPADCTERVEDNNAVEWAYLLVQCTNQTSCSYLFQSSTFVTACSISEIVDYITIYYSCLPEEEFPVVAFTAYSELSYNYKSGDVIIFDQTVSNLGGNFNTETSIFLCPYTGLYQFSIHILAAINSTAQANIMLDGQQLVIAWADQILDAYPQSSNTVMVECTQGQTVWVESSSSVNGSRIFNNAFKHTTFSGVLLQKYD